MAQTTWLSSAPSLAHSSDNRATRSGSESNVETEKRLNVVAWWSFQVTDPSAFTTEEELFWRRNMDCAKLSLFHLQVGGHWLAVVGFKAMAHGKVEP